jgi:hypothetical protein
MKLNCTLLGVILLASSHAPIEKSNTTKTLIHNPFQIKNSNEWLFDKVEGKVLRFKNGKMFNTSLYSLKYIGQITNDNKAPFLIFSGRDCNECDANISIYIHSSSNGHLNVENGENRYGFPGTERDLENNKPVFKSRAFYGQVLPGIKGVIWYQNQLMENKSWQKSIFFVNLNGGVKKETTSKDVEKLKLTLQLLEQGSCKEIKGVDYTSEP